MIKAPGKPGIALDFSTKTTKKDTHAYTRRTPQGSLHYTPEHCNLYMVASLYFAVEKASRVSNGCNMRHPGATATARGALSTVPKPKRWIARRFAGGSGGRKRRCWALRTPRELVTTRCSASMTWRCQGLIPSPFCSSALFKNRIRLWALEGLLKRRIPGKNGEGTPRIFFFWELVRLLWRAFLQGSQKDHYPFWGSQNTCRSRFGGLYVSFLYSSFLRVGMPFVDVFLKKAIHFGGSLKKQHSPIERVFFLFSHPKWWCRCSFGFPLKPPKRGSLKKDAPL